MKEVRPMEAIINKGKEHIMNTYNRFPIVFEKGSGVYLEDASGK
jgi:acetylornithine/succinyldiaminopimelate/putrescine aminotransferase